LPRWCRNSPPSTLMEPVPVFLPLQAPGRCKPFLCPTSPVMCLSTGLGPNVANPRPIDLAALAVSVAPLRLALFVSCLVGLAIGVVIIIVCAFVTTLLLPLGFFPMLGAIIATSVNAAQLTMIAVAA